MSDACRELRAALGALALGNADPAEEIALRAHIEGCAECRAELRELSSVAAVLPRADIARVTHDPTAPPDELGARVLGRVAAERSARRTRTRRRVATAAASAVAIAAAIVALVLVAPGNSPGTRVVFPATGGVSATATLHSRTAGTEVAFHVTGLHSGEYYWLWVTGADGDRIGAGTFQGTGPQSTDLVMTAALPLSAARRIWVTDDHDKVVLDERLPAPA